MLLMQVIFYVVSFRVISVIVFVNELKKNVVLHCF